MKPKTVTYDSAINHRRIGRKALLADRLSHAVGNKKDDDLSAKIKRLLSNPKKAALVGSAIVIVVSLALTGTKLVNDQVATAQSIQAATTQRVLKQKSEAADACRRQKFEQKAELVGKVTYDEMYDGNACDR